MRLQLLQPKRIKKVVKLRASFEQPQPEYGSVFQQRRSVQAQLVDTDNESELEKAPLEAEEYWGTFELIKDTKGERSEPDSEREREGSEDESLNSDDERKSHGLDDEIHGLDDEGHGLDDEVVLVVNTAVSEPLGLGYKAARCCALESTEEIAPSAYEVGQSSKSVLEQEGAERKSAFRQPTLVTWVDPKDGRVYTNILTYVPPAAPVQTLLSPEWSPAIISVDEDLFLEGLRELYTRSGVVRDEMFSHRYGFRSLKRQQERVAVTFSAIWRPVLALEAWAGQTDAQRAALWHAIYDIHKENHDLRRQIAKERHERLELTYRIARIERRQESGGE
nr:hypothetical protein [Tanacetum cinerariifolium]